MHGTRLLAFVVAGLIWIAATYLTFRGPSPILGLIAASYVAFSSIAMSIPGRRLGQTLAVLWALAVLLLGTVAYLAESGIWGAIYVGTLVGTVLFGLWIGTGLAIEHLLRSGRQRPHS
ncbi:hypothetical protein FHP29_03610 [Nocardioides albidus]|uniref:Uncharacterized protein n=1 Tax=Nocardioides albidus TaxID=1517589 RepID=A0A5C4WFE1_9ACTN|nr:hypothetical protein FHP29_03610 [Nocardioides albidus]